MAPPLFSQNCPKSFPFFFEHKLKYSKSFIRTKEAEICIEYYRRVLSIFSSR